MRDLHYENQGTNTYLVYNIGPDEVVDSMSLGMLTNNKIHGLAQTLFTQMDDQKIVKFNVSAKVSVAQFFTGAVNKKRLIGVFTGIVNAMIAAEDYMLDPSSIILDMNYIFTDVSTCETDLICLPLVDMELQPVNLSAFFRNIMMSTQFDQTENCDYMAKIINYLNGTPLFSLNDFKKLLEDLQDSNVQPTISARSETQNFVPAQANAQHKQQPVVNQTPSSSSGFQKTENRSIGGQQQKIPSNSMMNGMVVPQKQSIQKNTVSNVTAEAEKSEEISFFYLMQHYNKENAAAYKAQKNAKKQAKEDGSTQVLKTVKQEDSKTSKKEQNSVGFGFAIPGQAAAVQQKPAVQQSAVEQQPVQQKVSPQPQVQQTVIKQPTYTQQQMPQGKAMNFGETTVLSAGNKVGETTVLGVAPTANQPNPHLIRTKNNEKINLNKPVFRIGKEKSYVDYFIGDNTAISRSHANFITRDGQYYVTDTNSTNHTYVNGTMIQSNVETQLSHGDKVRLANEDFEFKLF